MGGGLVFYEISAFKGNAIGGTAGSCAAAPARTAALDALSKGEVAAVRIAKAPKIAPALAFTGPDGAARTLADWKGRAILLNLWATWCVPCRQEMPALDRLQAALGGRDFEVVAVNIDTRDPDKPKTWLKEAGVSRLGFYADPSAGVFKTLRQAGEAIGMPTTLLIDAQGCELGRMEGPAEWASDDALALMKAVIAGR